MFLVLFTATFVSVVLSQKDAPCPENHTLVNSIDSGSVSIQGPSSLTYEQLTGDTLTPVAGVHTVLINLTCPGSTSSSGSGSSDSGSSGSGSGSNSTGSDGSGSDGSGSDGSGSDSGSGSGSSGSGGVFIDEISLNVKNLGDVEICLLTDYIDHSDVANLADNAPDGLVAGWLDASQTVGDADAEETKLEYGARLDNVKQIVLFFNSTGNETLEVSDFSVEYCCPTSCDPNPCENNGICIDNTEGGFTCCCQQGFEGDTCSINVDECAKCNGPCENNATCVDGINGFTCLCQALYTGEFCQTQFIDPDDCVPLPCLNGGTCNDEFQAYSCNCSVGYTGQDCQTNIDDCDPQPCQNGGTCTDDVNSFNCSCVTGFTGDICETNIDDCNPDPCLNGGTCVDGVNSYTCTCPPGYTGPNCESDIDECADPADTPCDPVATCTNNVGSFVCACPCGFTGDGFTCTQDNIFLTGREGADFEYLSNEQGDLIKQSFFAPDDITQIVCDCASDIIVAGDDASELSVYDPLISGFNPLVPDIGGAICSIALDVGRNKVFVGVKSIGVKEVDLQTGTETTIVSDGTYTVPAVATDIVRERLYYVGVKADLHYVSYAAGSTYTATTLTNDFDKQTSLYVDYDDGKLYVAWQKGEIYATDLDDPGNFTLVVPTPDPNLGDAAALAGIDLARMVKSGNYFYYTSLHSDINYGRSFWRVQAGSPLPEKVNTATLGSETNYLCVLKNDTALLEL